MAEKSVLLMTPIIRIDLAKALILAKKNEEAKKILPAIYAALDKAAKVGVIKKNNASRRKSRLTKIIDKK